MEQNTLIPAAGGTAGDHSIKAVAAMFGRSPLCFWVSVKEPSRDSYHSFGFLKGFYKGLC